MSQNTISSSGISWDTIGLILVWQFLIPLAAGWAQTILYSVFIRAGDPKPPPGSPRFLTHRKYILIAFYFAYFVFTIYEVDFNLQRSANAYHQLGVPIDVDDTGLNTRFRKLAVQFHPDKLRKASPEQREMASHHFVRLTAMRDIILDPVKRFAYDRFGPDVQCNKCITVSDYVESQLFNTGTTYGAVILFLVVANALGYFSDGAYWRYLAILAVGAFEARTAMRPDFPSFLTLYLNPFATRWGLRPAYLPFQLTSIIKKATISAVQFLAILMPLYRLDPQQPLKPTEDTEDARHKQLDRLSAFVAETNKESGRLLELESIPYKENEKAKSELREAFKKYMVQNVVHQEKDVRNAIGQSMAKRRQGVPHGAQGTR